MASLHSTDDDDAHTTSALSVTSQHSSYESLAEYRGLVQGSHVGCAVLLPSSSLPSPWTQVVCSMHASALIAGLVVVPVQASHVACALAVAAILAPNHFLSEPWRFYLAGPETKAKLCGLNEEKRKAAEGVPEWLVVTCASAPV